MSETKLKIRTVGDPVLRKHAKPVNKISEGHQKLLSRMAKVMYESQGIGLAAPQIGVGEQLVVIDIGEGLYKLINPKIVKKEGAQAIAEGCLSVPGVCIKVKRANYVCVEAKDELGNPLNIQANELFACVLQHEIDHLQGKLIIDYASLMEKMRLRKKLKIKLL